jgi:hypothetical protein
MMVPADVVDWAMVRLRSEESPRRANSMGKRVVTLITTTYCIQAFMYVFNPLSRYDRETCARFQPGLRSGVDVIYHPLTLCTSLGFDVMMHVHIEHIKGENYRGYRF